MTWLFIPYDSVYALINSEELRALVTKHAFLESHAPIANKRLQLSAAGNNAFLSVWPDDIADEQAVAATPLLAIWYDVGSSTLAALPDEILPATLERLCILANRLWGGLPVPTTWRAAKVGGYQTIFATTAVDNLRVVYGIQSIGPVSHITIGSVFYAYRQEKSITLPILSTADLAALPDQIARPSDSASAPDDAPLDDDEEIIDHRKPDVLIERTAGENRHLFSMTRADWMRKGSPLTAQQRRIITEATYPLRIHGPGGSGKTLVLILKALTLLTDAANRGQTCKVLVVLHNNDVRNNVRAATEAIDEAGFLATTKDDLQFLDVETLHGWCMRELKVDTGGIDYALHTDTVDSKLKQDEILSSIVKEAVSSRLPRMRSLLSADLVSHFEGPFDKLLTNCRHEIAVRIKGRGLRHERKLYVESPLRSFVGSKENQHDRYFLFKISEEYERELQKIGRLDTDDIVLSMQSRLAAPLWNRQRTTAGYDFVLVDETHLFNENERRVLPYLTRTAEERVPIIMAFDEAQSIGGRRGVELEKIGIHKSEKRRLSYVHRSSPDIYRLARDLVERTTLMFSEFGDGEAIVRMSERDRKKCKPSAIYFTEGRAALVSLAVSVALELRSKNYPRVAVVLFGGGYLRDVAAAFHDRRTDSHVLQERGDSTAGNPFPGIFIMTAENCGGLEFDAVILTGVDSGFVPPSLHNISPEGHLSVREEASRELYTAITRARYHLAFVCDRLNGPSEFIEPWISGGLLQEVRGTASGSTMR